MHVSDNVGERIGKMSAFISYYLARAGYLGEPFVNRRSNALSRIEKGESYTKYVVGLGVSVHKLTGDQHRLTCRNRLYARVGFYPHLSTQNGKKLVVIMRVRVL